MMLEVTRKTGGRVLMRKKIQSPWRRYPRRSLRVTSRLVKSEAENRLAKFGPNCLTPPRKTPDSSRRCSWGSPCFSGTRQSFAMSPMVSILPMETRVSYANLYVALTLVVIVSGLFNYYQENKSSKIMLLLWDTVLPLTANN